MIQNIGTKLLWVMVFLALLMLPLAVVNPWFLLAELLFVPMVILGLSDLFQTQHSILRNFPILGHFRFLLEDIGPELHQYLIEDNTGGTPFNRDTRSLIYRRAKGVADEKAFGTERNVYDAEYAWLAHSIAPHPVIQDAGKNLRVTIGGPDCTQPYSSSVLNISAMSFGALGGAAVQAMNLGAQRGGFAHDTGEGGISRYHREHGGDLIWQIGTGYFGCRDAEGGFDPEQFAVNATDPQVKMIEIKLSQGAKPGHGGILPGAKVTKEIAEARQVPIGQTVFSPTYHQAFSDPKGLCAFIGQLRQLSGGKPVGFKLCVGHPLEVMSIAHAMIDTGICPDFIVVDGGEGGTGAAPLEFSDSMGFPLEPALVLVHNVMVGAGLRDKIKIGASGKMVTASAIASSMALGADWCNSARGFMFAVGCIQSQKCQTNTCPVGVTTQNPKLQRALVVPDKATRVQQFHYNTVEALAEMVAAMGLDHTSQLDPSMIFKWFDDGRVDTISHHYTFHQPRDLVDGKAAELSQLGWDLTTSETFMPPGLPQSGVPLTGTTAPSTTARSTTARSTTAPSTTARTHAHEIG
ncbi:MAG: FMN-binding glutamate synthase family protein [Microthrixaceae bacterium]